MTRRHSSRTSKKGLSEQGEYASRETVGSTGEDMTVARNVYV